MAYLTFGVFCLWTFDSSDVIVYVTTDGQVRLALIIYNLTTIYNVALFILIVLASGLCGLKS